MSRALGDLYENSWRFLAVNTAFGVLLVVIVLGALSLPAAAVAAVLTGPIVAGMVHMSVKLVRTGNVTLRDARAGIGQHWRRGVALTVVAVAGVLLCVLALRFYAQLSLGWPLVFLTFYLSVMFGVYYVILWTLAIAEPARPLRSAARGAAELFAARPGQTLGLGLALLVVNLVGIAAAFMPFLTITVAYSCLAVARFALPEEPA